MTNDEKRCNLYDNSKHKKSNIHDAKAILCIWSDQKGALYHGLANPSDTSNEERYRQQLIKYKQAIAEKRPEFVTRHETIILHYDNTQPHVAGLIKNYNYLVNGWDVLLLPPYRPDLASSNYHLFWSKQKTLTEIWFTSEQDISV